MSDSIYKIGVIGLGSMGTGYMKHLAASNRSKQKHKAWATYDGTISSGRYFLSPAPCPLISEVDLLCGSWSSSVHDKAFARHRRG